MNMRLLAGALLASVLLSHGAQAQVTCTPTGMMRDSINLTAALINPGNVIDQDVDATGCNIGIYFGPGSTGRVIGSNIYGANYFGIVQSGGTVNIRNSRIHDIGEVPFNGTQHGVAIYCDFNSPEPSKGVIRNNVIWNYQKGGIVLSGPNCSGKQVAYNVVTGFGPVNFIAQNGIQVGLGANSNVVSQNSVSGHVYTGPGQASSGGFIGIGGDCFGGQTIKRNRVLNNIFVNNDVGAYVVNLDSSCAIAPVEPTRNKVAGNTFFHDRILNETGNGTGPYQVGLSIAASKDEYSDNSICGAGYGADTQPSGGFIAPVDTAGSQNNLTLRNNVCMPVNVVTPVLEENTVMASAKSVFIPKVSAEKLAKRIQPVDAK